MTNEQIQLERNKLLLYEKDKKRFAHLARHYFNLVQNTTKLIEEMEAELKAEVEAEAEAQEA